jgi:hypothetical protein
MDTRRPPLAEALIDDFRALSFPACAVAFKDQRDKRKDVYDLVSCLDRYPGGLASLAAE